MDTQNTTPNPLSAYFRQPQIYVKLPSGGKYWPQGALAMGDSEELAVYAMTARDEMMMNTPDALLNGEATVSVIHSCIPQIKNAWEMPMIDVDTILIAIRIASYGESMDIATVIPKVNKSYELKVDLRLLMDQVVKGDFQEWMELSNGLHVKLNPLNYRQQTNIALKAFEEQSLMRSVEDATLSSSQKRKKYTSIISNLANLNFENILSAIKCVKTPEGEVEDAEYIRQFVTNIDYKLGDEIKKHVEKYAKLGAVPPVTVQTPEEHIKEGAPASYTVPISLDNSNFFVSKSFQPRSLI